MYLLGGGKEKRSKPHDFPLCHREYKWTDEVLKQHSITFPWGLTCFLFVLLTFSVVCDLLTLWIVHIQEFTTFHFHIWSHTRNLWTNIVTLPLSIYSFTFYSFLICLSFSTFSFIHSFIHSFISSDTYTQLATIHLLISLIAMY